jgi:hypothetical protein
MLSSFVCTKDKERLLVGVKPTLWYMFEDNNFPVSKGIAWYFSKDYNYYQYYVSGDSVEAILSEDELFSEQKWHIKNDTILDVVHAEYKIIRLNKDTLWLLRDNVFTKFCSGPPPSHARLPK